MRLDPLKPFTDIYPTLEYEFSFPVEAVPQPLIMKILIYGILRLLHEKRSRYEG